MTRRERKYHERKGGEKITDRCQKHGCDYQEEYYGIRCRRCGVFYPHGGEPWAPDDDVDDEFEDTRIHTCPGCGGEYQWGEWSTCTCEQDEDEHPFPAPVRQIIISDDDDLPF